MGGTEAPKLALSFAGGGEYKNIHLHQYLAAQLSCSLDMGFVFPWENGCCSLPLLGRKD